MTRAIAGRQWQLWFACLAMLLNAMSPTLSYAYVYASRAAHVASVAYVSSASYTNSVVGDICFSSNADGAATSAAAAAPATAAQLARSATDSVLHHIEHCPFCLSHAGSAGLPPSMHAAMAIASGHDHTPPLFYQAPQAQFAWTAARPRGPPTPS